MAERADRADFTGAEAQNYSDMERGDGAANLGIDSQIVRISQWTLSPAIRSWTLLP